MEPGCRQTFTVSTVAAYFTTKCSFNFGNSRRYKTVRTASKRQVKRSASDEVKDANKILKLMGLLKERRHRRGLVEDCEVITASTPGIFKCRGVLMSTSILRPGVYRHWLQCPRCGRQSFKLYRPCGATVFACPECHHLVYKSSLKKTDPRRALPGKMFPTE